MPTTWAMPGFRSPDEGWVQPQRCAGCYQPFALGQSSYHVGWAPGGVILWQSPPLCEECYERARKGMTDIARAALAATETQSERQG